MLSLLSRITKEENKNKGYKQGHSIKQERHNSRSTFHSNNIPIDKINQITHNKMYAPQETKPTPDR
jgi:hypothetical protein